MKKNQFMARLSDELKRRNVADAADGSWSVFAP